MGSRAATILVVDDEPAVLRLVELNLELDGYVVITASNGVEAIDLASQHRPDLIVLDVMMPGLDGLEVAERLKSDPATQAIPIIFLSARSAASDVSLGLAAGAASYMTKPFDAAVLSAKIAALLQG